MKRIAACLVSLAALTGCGSGDSTGAIYAVEACGLTKPSGGGDWVAPPLSPSETKWTIGSPLSELEEASERWAENAVNATRAAGEDSRYVNLRDTTTAISGMRSSVVSWASSNPGKHAQLSTLSTSDPFLQQGLAVEERLLGSPGYNDLLQTWKIECNAVADELNS